MNSTSRKILILITAISIYSCVSNEKHDDYNGVWISTDPNKSVLCVFEGDMILSDDTPFLIQEILFSKTSKCGYYFKDKIVYNDEDFKKSEMVICFDGDKLFICDKDADLLIKNNDKCLEFESFRLNSVVSKIDYMIIKIKIGSIRSFFMDFPFREIAIKSNDNKGDLLFSNNQICGKSQLLSIFNKISYENFDSIYLGNSYLPGSSSFSIEIKEFGKPIKLINIHGFDYSIPVELRIIIQAAILNAYLLSS